MTDPTIFNYSLLDDEGLSNNTDVYVAYDGLTETEAALEAAWVAIGSALDKIVDAKITGGSITIPLQPYPGILGVGAWKTAPVDGNNVNQVMNLNFNNDFNSYATSLLVPSYKESVLTPSNMIDLADTDLAAFITLILGGVAGEVFPNSRDLHDLNALRDAFLTVRKVRNQRRATIVHP